MQLWTLYGCDLEPRFCPNSLAFFHMALLFLIFNAVVYLSSTRRIINLIIVITWKTISDRSRTNVSFRSIWTNPDPINFKSFCKQPFSLKWSPNCITKIPLRLYLSSPEDASCSFFINLEHCIAACYKKSKIFPIRTLPKVELANVLRSQQRFLFFRIANTFFCHTVQNSLFFVYIFCFHQ